MNTQELQNKIKDWLISSEIEADIYNQYLKNGTFEVINENRMGYIVSSDFAKTILVNVEKELNQWLKNDLNETVLFSFLTKKDVTTEKNKQTISLRNAKELHTFETFISGPSNIGAYTAAKRAVENYGAYNPIFIYGNSGLGKTHLLQSVEDYVKKNTSMSVAYIQSESFRNELIRALSAQNSFDAIENFKAKYINVDYFLLDDVQILASSSKTNEILFSIFNDLIKKERQIILTSDKFPEKLNGFEKRLISRFISGLSVELKPLDQETSLNILRNKLMKRDFEITDEAQKYIASYYSDNVRKLDGIFMRIDFGLIQGEITSPIDLKQLENILNNYELSSVEEITVSHIKSIVAKEYNTTITNLEGKTRTQPYAFARQLAMKLTHELLKLNYTQIGNEFGGRDHSTVLHAVTKVDEDIKNDKNIARVYKKIKKMLTK